MSALLLCVCYETSRLSTREKTTLASTSVFPWDRSILQAADPDDKSKHHYVFDSDTSRAPRRLHCIAPDSGSCAVHESHEEVTDISSALLELDFIMHPYIEHVPEIDQVKPTASAHLRTYIYATSFKS